MFTEPVTVTVNAVAKNLNRVSFGNLSGTFASRADGLKLRITHVEGKRNRRTVRLDINQTVPDAFITGVNREVSASVFLTIDAPVVGFSDAELMQKVQGLIDWLDDPANLTKVIGGES